MRCRYCGGPLGWVTGKTVYPHRPDLHGRTFVMCEPCWAYVGCHPGTDRPLGSVADAELRRWRMRAHAAFDWTWRSGRMRRGEAYGWLAQELGLPRERCHIGGFEREECQAVVAAVRRYRATFTGQ